MGWARVNFKTPKTPDFVCFRKIGGFWGFLRPEFEWSLKTPKTPDFTDSKGVWGFWGFSQISS